MITVDEMVESGECPCEICSSQESWGESMDKQKIDGACDLISNQIIDLIIRKPKKSLLKKKNKRNNVE